MGRVAVPPSEAMARLLRDRRHQLGLTLREVEERSSRLGQPIPFTTLAKAERGRVDPGLRRLHVLLKIYEIPFRLAEDLLELEAFAAERPAPDVAADTLQARAVESWKAGDLQQAFAGLAALRALDPADAAGRLEKQRALVSLAITISGLGRYRLSKQIVDELLLEPPEPEVLVSVLVQAAVCWYGLGGFEAALAFLGRADEHLGPDDHRQRAWVLHHRSATLTAMRRFDEAEESLQAAREAYRAADDAYGSCRLAGMHVRLQIERGDHAGAARIASAAREEAERRGYRRLVVMRQLDEGRALVHVGEVDRGVGLLSDALAEAIHMRDQESQFHAHFHLWKAWQRAGDPARAEMERQAARYFLRYVDRASREAEEVRQDRPRE